MIEIDGSYGEGGGQILRTSISLSALTLKPVRVTNIRANRPQPGLKKQHLGGVELTARLVNADVDGLKIGSTEVIFQPKERRGGEFTLDVGTAGSISLLLQAALLPATLAPNQVTFKLRGGTDVNWSPPIDYLREVFARVLAKLGPSIEIRQVRRGHYPRGGGEVVCRVIPVQHLSSIKSVDFGEVKEISGISHCVRLPEHIAARQAASAMEVLEDKLGIKAVIRTESYPKSNDPHLSPGSGIVLWAISEDSSVLGADRLGEKGEKAELVGTKAALHLVEEISTGKAIDSHLCDMLVPYLAIADRMSEVGLTEITSHLMTNVWTIQKILGTKIEIEGDIGGSGVMRVFGQGLLS
ncbi:MAG: RNA 3'-terminal phosphate cyclase [Candidatus Thorarchaeota archaeon]